MREIRVSELRVMRPFQTSSLACAIAAVLLICPSSIAQEREKAPNAKAAEEQEAAARRYREALEELQRQKRMVEEQRVVAEHQRRRVEQELARQHAEQEQHAAKLEAELQKAQAQLAELTTRQKAAQADQLWENMQLRVYSMRDVKPQNLAEILHGVLGKNMPRIAIDDRSNSLLVAGTEKQLAIVEQLAETLDRPAVESKEQKPAETLQIRVVWLLDVDEGMEPNEKLVSPQVVEALGELGFEHPKVVSQQVTSVTLGENRRGQFQFEAPVLIQAQPWQFEGRGEIEPISDERFRLNFNMGFQKIQSERGFRPRAGQQAQLGGSIYTPLGHYTVMGTTTFVASDVDETHAEGKDPEERQHLSAFVVYLDRAREFPGAGADATEHVDVHP